MLRVLRNRWRAGAGLALLVVLAGCAGHFLAQREPWRKDAEIACMQSGAVKETGTIVRVEPINGPGMCGADFPFKVAALGESAMLGYSSGDLRPPGSVPNAPSQRWPVPNDPGFVPAPPPARDDPRDVPPPKRQIIQNEPQYSNPMRQNSKRDAPGQRQAIVPSSAGGARNGAAPMPILPPAAAITGALRRASRRAITCAQEPSRREGHRSMTRRPVRRPTMRMKSRRPALGGLPLRRNASACNPGRSPGGRHRRARLYRCRSGAMLLQRSGRSRSGRRRRSPVRSCRHSIAGSPSPCSLRRSAGFASR